MIDMEMDHEGIIHAVDLYMERLLGFSVGGNSFSMFSEAVGEGFPPFAKGCSVLELHTKQGAFRAVAPGQAAEILTLPLDYLPGSRMDFSILIPERLSDGFGDVENAVPIPPDALVEGGGRMPARDYAYGVNVGGRFISWACAADYGEVMYITVETSPAYRGRGYAKDALRAITAQLLRAGRAPVYFAEARNTASIKTAFAAGYAGYGTLTRIL